MPSSVASTAVPRHRLLSEISRPRVAKADLPKAEIAEERARVGAMVRRCRSLRGLSLKEFASAVNRDERQVGRWETGEERVHVDALKLAGFWNDWLQAQAEAGGVPVEITVRIPRSA